MSNTTTNGSLNENGQSITLIKFWAPWCSPCKAMYPIVESVVENCSLHLKSINIDEDPNSAVEYGIRSIPTLVLLKDGVPSGKLIGTHSSKEIEKFLTENGV